MRRIIKKIKFWVIEDRIGPDMPLTHWLLYSSRLGNFLCNRKFRKFPKTASVRAGVYAVACSKIEIGEYVVIRPGSMLHADPRDGGAGIIIEDKVLIGSSVHMYVDTHCFSNRSIPVFDQGYLESKQIIIKKGAWIGANTVILPGVTIGQNAVIGAGSVVTKSVPQGVTAVGNPARVIS